MEHDTEEDRRAGQVRRALVKALALVGVIALLVALGTVLVVRALGLNGNDSAGAETSGTPRAAAPSGPAPELPTTALPVPGQDDASGGSPSSQPTAPQKRRSELQLDASPVRARAGERVNLAGRYRGGDDATLQVQRYEDGEWRDFGVDAGVTAGSYGTYVLTSRPGEQRFRMWDPVARRGSNVVLVTIG